MELYGTVPCMFRLLEVLWYHQEVLTLQNRYHIPHFKETQGTTQGVLVSTTLFNFIFKNVVSNWDALMVKDQLLLHKVLLLAVGRCLELFYSYNRVVGYWGL